MAYLTFNDRVVIVTGAGGGLGQAHAKLLASRGAKVVVNDINRSDADGVVNAIQQTGGQAIANYSSVLDGEAIVQQAIDHWGRVDAVVNNAGVIRDKSFKGANIKDWDQVTDIHVKGAFAVTKAAWPHMRKQKFGRIVNTASGAGLYGNFGQSSYSAAKMGLISFAKTLAVEGAKYNITANALVPYAASPMTATIMDPATLAALDPALVAPVVAFLCHESNTDTGGIWETGGGWVSKVRWERSKGAYFKLDDTFTPSAVRSRWPEISDFKYADHPSKPQDTNLEVILKKAQAVAGPNSTGSKEVRFDGKVAIVTGAGAGLGRAYALMYGMLGAQVLVNDLNPSAAQEVVRQITSSGGTAQADSHSVEDGENIVKAAIEAFGTVHVLVNNAGILRDKSFGAMSETDWDVIFRIHARGTFATCHAAWPYFQKQKYGRIINTTSPAAIFGNYGQANYSTAKAAIIGLTKTLALEGNKYNITASAVVPNAGTAMTATIWPQELVNAFKPDYVAPFVGFLTSESAPTAVIVEATCGWGATYHWQRTHGYRFANKTQLTLEKVGAQWAQIGRFDGKCTFPISTQDSLDVIFNNFGTTQDEESTQVDYFDPQDSALVKKAKQIDVDDYEFTYNEKDVALYNAGIGATERDLRYTYEGHPKFMALPTFGVVPQLPASQGAPLDWLPNYNPKMLLHGEQFLAIKSPIPTHATLVTKVQLVEVLDKGKAASVTWWTTTRDKRTGNVVFENSSTLFIRGAGGFGGAKTSKDRGAITAVNTPPKREADAVVEETTLARQAMIYRLSGDWNPLHIDPETAKAGGFEKPILHGLCSFGIVGKHIYERYGEFIDFKARFAGTLVPGETLQTSMWKEGNKIIVMAKCKERGQVVLSNAGATLVKRSHL